MEYDELGYTPCFQTNSCLENHGKSLLKPYCLSWLFLVRLSQNSLGRHWPRTWPLQACIEKAWARKPLSMLWTMPECQDLSVWCSCSTVGLKCGVKKKIRCGYSNDKPSIFWWFIPPIYGDERGMVYYCYTNIICLPHFWGLLIKFGCLPMHCFRSCAMCDHALFLTEVGRPNTPSQAGWFEGIIRNIWEWVISPLP